MFLVVRMISWTPSSDSSWWMCMLTVGCEIYSSLDAFVKLRLRTTSTND